MEFILLYKFEGETVCLFGCLFLEGDSQVLRVIFQCDDIILVELESSHHIVLSRVH